MEVEVIATITTQAWGMNTSNRTATMETASREQGNLQVLHLRKSFSVDIDWRALSCLSFFYIVIDM